MAGAEEGEYNLFRTYRNGGNLLHLYYIPNSQSLTVLCETLANTSLPTADTTADYTALSDCPTTLTQIGIACAENISNTYNGMSYVMRLADGSFLVIDGGHNVEANADHIYQLLQKQAKTEDIVIAAWIFTHAHYDHVLTFPLFAQKYSERVEIERFIYNFPSASRYSGTEASEGYETSVYNAIKTYYPDSAVTVAHAGQKFQIRNATLNILYAAELYTPVLIDDYNSSSLVFTVETDGVKCFFFGDATESVANILQPIYAASIFASDIMQVSHHGINSSPKALYPLVAPSYVLWPLTTEYNGNDYDYNNRDYVNQSQNNYFKTYTKDANLWMSDDDIVILTFRNGTVSAEKNESVTDWLNSAS